MFASCLLLSLVLLPLSFAAVHHVQVGAEGKLLYNPEAIFAAAGDEVVFHFQSKNHTVTQSSFANPCAKKDDGFASGFKPVTPDMPESDRPTYTVHVNNTDPIWIYCGQARGTPSSHCGAGMVFAINCGPDDAPNSFLNFKNAALDHGRQLKAAAEAGSTTAAYGTLTVPAAPTPTVVTKTITLQASTWTTTYSSYPGAPDPTPATLEGRVHRIVVGGPGQLLFDPPSVSALPRDTIVFEFRQKNHTVTQSTFEDPCRPFSGGFDSEFKAVAEGETTFPTWNFTVTDTAPTWAYCRQRTPTSHCGAGMVFAINPADEASGGRSFSAFQNVAKTLNGTSAAATTPDDDDDGAGTNTESDPGSAAALGQNKFAMMLAFVIAASASAL